MKKFPGREFHVRNSREIPGSGIPDIGIDFTITDTASIPFCDRKFWIHLEDLTFEYDRKNFRGSASDSQSQAAAFFSYQFFKNANIGVKTAASIQPNPFWFWEKKDYNLLL